MAKKKPQKKEKYDKRNILNDLSGREWLLLTKSIWISEKCADDKFAFQHPAPFLINDIRKLVRFFTKKNMIVLDPFCGSGTTLVACAKENRKGVGIDLNKKYCQMSKKRLQDLKLKNNQQIICGDSLKKIPAIKGKMDYCVTSPPYHNILRHNGGGLREVKDKDVRNGARLGVEYYSNDKRDLGNQTQYKDFLQLLKKVMAEVYKKLRDKKYCSIIISDFTVNKKETNASGDVIRLMQDVGFGFDGAIVLAQDNKPLYPFGYPYAYKINHHHQYILNFRKL
ncbi:DNA methyltransferase [Candidatus Roizmanbacteria bacterium CG_4_8_14_3_um_filter_36_10]|uniref:Methyltransferase n=1 Tax=Candidatus Roizmanbacteria bacterium CG_4_8_14_3_um_filter_36_10 TaxID=1974834 RepID=A0A2M8GKU9_9BACT|nr:MAG: DNA methyltransferase [Candidatus Roizmanbacteria bacterium CG_4_8_14_3_um_filter_36_10]